jgi:superoxide dismutase, Cu-Zn family
MEVLYMWNPYFIPQFFDDEDQINNRPVLLPAPSYAYYPYENLYRTSKDVPKPTERMTAIAQMKGGPLAPNLTGVAYFQAVSGGTQVYVEVTGLPAYEPGSENKAPIGPHGFHLHENGNCEVGDPSDPFQAAGGHWNPTNQPHGNHAGDFPVLFSNDGMARMCFFTNKFKPDDIIGRAVILHQNPDDYRSQPAGDAGKRLACGVIR